MSSSQQISTQETPRLCTHPDCPSIVSHNAGHYNFGAMHGRWVTNKVPEDICLALNMINSNLSSDPLDHDFGYWALVAKFAVVHHSHRTGLMPGKITSRKPWQHPKTQKILESEDPRPLNLFLRAQIETKAAPDATVTVDEGEKQNKIVKPARTTGRIGMNRGVPLTEKFNPVIATKPEKKITKVVTKTLA